MDKITTYNQDNNNTNKNNSCLEKCKSSHECDWEASLDLKQLVYRLKLEIERIEALLINCKFGLPEIKSEVRNIENITTDPDFGLKEIKAEISEIGSNLENSNNKYCKIIAGLRRIINLLNNPHYGLKEIKIEVANIESTVNAVASQMGSVAGGVVSIENKLDNPFYGLAEIKTEVANIESTVNIVGSQICGISGGVLSIENKLDNPAYGLAEIKAEVANIESTVNIIASQIGCLTSEVIRIENRLENPDYAMAEIPAKIKNIVASLSPYDGLATYTTGVCSADSSANSLVAIVHNSTASPKTISINANVYFSTIGVQPAQQNSGSKLLSPIDGSDKDIVIPPNCTIIRVYSLNPSNSNPLGVLFEVQYTGLSSGVTAFTAARKNSATSSIESSSWISSNVYRFSDLTRC